MKFDDLNLDGIFLESKTEILQEVGEGFDSKATRFLTGIDSTLMQQAEQELAAVKTEAQRMKLISDLDGLIYELNRRKNEGTFWKFFKHWFVAGVAIPVVGGIIGLVWAAVKRGNIKSGETDAIINFLSDVKSRAQRLQLNIQTESMAQPNNGKKRGKAGDSKIILESVEDKLRNVDAWLKDVNENLKRLNVREDGTIVAANIDEATFGRNLEMTAARINVIAKSTLNAGSGIIAYSIALKLSRNLGLNVGGPLNVIQNFKAFLTLNPLAYSTNKKIVFVILGCALITIYNAIKFGSNIISYLRDRKNFAEKGEIRNSKVIIQNESQEIYSIENIDAFLESDAFDYSAFLEAKNNKGKKIEGGLSGLGALNNKDLDKNTKLMKDGNSREYAMLKDIESLTREGEYFKRANDIAKKNIKYFETSKEDDRKADDIAGQVLYAVNNVSRYTMNKILPGNSGVHDNSIPDKRTASIALKHLQKINTLMKSKYSSYAHIVSQSVDFIGRELAEVKTKPVEIAEDVSKEVKQEEIITKTETAQLTKAHEEIKEKVIEKEINEIADEKPTVKKAIKENNGEVPASIKSEAKKEVEDTELGTLATKAISGEKLNAEEKELASNLVSNQQVSSIWTRIKNRAANYGKNRSTTGGAIRGGIKIAVLYFITMKLAKSVDGIEIKGYKNITSNLSEMRKIRPWKSVRQFIIAGLLMIMANEAAKMGVGLGRALISKI